MAYTGTDWWPGLTPGESDTYSLDFTNDLQAGEALVSAGLVNGVDGEVVGAVTVTDINNVDSAAQSRLVQVALETPFVTSSLANGVPGANYRVSASYPTSLNRLLTLYSHIACAAEA